MDPVAYSPQNLNGAGQQQPYPRVPIPYSNAELLNHDNGGSDVAGLHGVPSETLPYSDENKSRVKRKRASKACDACRVRKVKCDANQIPCPQCAEHEIPCLFTAPAKKRGPPNAYVEAQKLRQAQQMDESQQFQPEQPVSYTGGTSQIVPIYGYALDPNNPGTQLHQAHSPSFPQPPRSSHGPGLEQLASPDALNAALDDFFIYCIPTVPFMIEAVFRRKLADYSSHTSNFLALCSSMIAITLTFLRPDPTRYGNLTYRAAYLFTIDHLGCHYRDNLDIEVLSTLACIGMASSFSEMCPLFENCQAAMLRAELFTGVQYFAQRESNRPRLNFVDKQILKRMLIFVDVGEVALDIQSIRLASAPTGVRNTTFKIDGDTMPLDISDADLERMAASLSDSGTARAQFSDLLVPSAKSYVAGLRLNWEMYHMFSSTLSARSDESRSRNSRYISCCQALHALRHSLDNAPVQLKWDEHNKVHGIGFEVQKANLHVSRMHLCSIVLEQCAMLSQLASGTDVDLDLSESLGVEHQRRLVTTETLRIIKTISRRALEANGTALIHRVRQVAATLVDVVQHERDQGDNETYTARKELSEFVEILGILDTKELPGRMASDNNISSTREDGWRRFMDRSDRQANGNVG